eukprot:GDKJ01016404.1.p1 GENE.GDKJ01016404.1~~GDKJ01016404.1.p1  ORF type:complete len:320 (+),score=108.05 GDKJ01016404.1:21-980(+)
MDEFIGNTISLELQNGDRFEGILEALDTEKSTLTIKDAKKFILGGVPFGCGRQVFHGDDVVNINIIEQTTAPVTVQPVVSYAAPPVPAFVDPAIIRVGTTAPQGVMYGQPPVHNNNQGGYNKNNRMNNNNNMNRNSNYRNNNQNNNSNNNQTNNQGGRQFNNNNQGTRQQHNNYRNNNNNNNNNNAQNQPRSNIPIGELPANTDAPLRKEFSEDFEFNADIPTVEKEKAEFATAPAAYNSKSSFFDNISCEKTDRNGQQRQNDTSDAQRRRQTNIETFGVAQAPRGPGFVRHRNNHRGGYRFNNSGNNPGQQNNNGPRN